MFDDFLDLSLYGQQRDDEKVVYHGWVRDIGHRFRGVRETTLSDFTEDGGRSQ